MNAKKILSLVLVIALVVCAAAAIVKNNEAASLTAQLADQNAALETAADLQAQLDALRKQKK